MKKFVIANWKSNKTREGVDAWLRQFTVQSSLDTVEVVICPPFPLLSMVSDAVKDDSKFKNLSLGVQDVSPYPAGRYTGAVSGQNLEGLGVKYAIVGHSERRRYFHETDEDVAKKVEQAVAADITPIVCVDESYVDSQARVIESDLLEKCVVAYEPLEAIGSGRSESVGEVKRVEEMIKQAFGSEVPIIYGGSVDEFNVNEYLLVSAGVLVGTASLDEKKFGRLIENAQPQNT